MHGSTIQVVCIEIVDAGGTMLLPWLLVANLNLGVLFHDLRDASAQVVQQSHEVIDFILLHQSNTLALVEFTHMIHEDLLQLLFTHPLVRTDLCDVLYPFLAEEP